MSRAVQVVMLAVLGGLPGRVLADVIEERHSIVVAAAVAAFTALAAVAWSVAARRVGALGHWAVAVLATLVGCLCVAVGAGAYAERHGETLAPALGDALTRGWGAVATSPVPAIAEARMLVPLALTVWAAVAGGVAVALRSQARVAPLLPGAAAFVLATIAAGRHQATPVITGVVFVTAGSLVLFLRTPRPAASHGRLTPSRGSLTTAAALIVVAAITAGFAGPALAAGRDRDPFDPRQHLSPPTVPGEAQNPLSLVAERLRNERDPVMFTVQADEPMQTRLVVLDSFDGVTWSATGSWVRVGASLTPPARTSVTNDEVDADITVEELGGPWIPTFGDPTAIVGVAAIADQRSGSLAVTDGNVTGMAYSLRADVVEFDETALNNASVAADAEGRAATELPVQPPVWVTAMANEATRGARKPFQQAALLEVYLQHNFDIDPHSRGGHSYGHLRRALTDTHVGTTEQFATGFAVLGRVVGLPTRVVVGFGPGTETEPGTYEVHASDVLVWPEVRFEGLGWVAFDPTPEPGDVAPEDVGTATVGPTGQQVPFELDESPTELDPADGAEPADETSAAQDAAPAPSSRSWTSRLVVVAPLTVVALAVAALVAVVAAKRLRTRRRRRAHDARQRVLGAWHDVLDRLVEAKVAEPHQRTVEEHVASAEGTPAGSTLTGLYRPVSKALYGHGTLATDDAEHAWRCRDRFVQVMRDEAGLSRRVRRAVALRPLVRPAGRRIEVDR